MFVCLFVFVFIYLREFGETTVIVRDERDRWEYSDFAGVILFDFFLFLVFAGRIQDLAAKRGNGSVQKE